MYKATFVFGYAWIDVLKRFENSDFANRMILENNYTTNALYRVGDILFVNTNELPAVYDWMGIDDSRQNEEGMFFQMQVPANGSAASQLFARYSSAIYNRWDYDPASGKYLRYVDSANGYSPAEEQYLPLTDKNNGQQISADNVAVIFVETTYYSQGAAGEVVDMTLLGSGPAWIARDGQIYQAQWVRMAHSDVLSLTGVDGKPFPFKPGNTWFEVMGTSSKVEQPDASTWRFTFHIP